MGRVQGERGLQCGEHVTRRNHVDTDPSMCPFNGQTGCQMPDSGFGRVVGRLWLRHVDDGARHGADHDHGAFGLALDEVPSHFAGEKVSAVDIDAPELPHAVRWVLDGVEVFGEAGRCDQVVNLTVILDNVGDDLIDRVVVGHVTEVGRDFGNPACVNCWRSQGL